MSTPSYLADDCERCGLCLHARSVLIHPRGADQPDFLLVGEAPGAVEDRAGEPFVGPSGELLDRMLQEAGVAADRCRWTNAVRCWPAGTPSDAHLEACRPYLLEEIGHVQPKVVVTLGVKAYQALTGKKSLGKSRGLLVQAPVPERVTVSPFSKAPPELSAAARDVPIVPTYHPAYVLYGNVSARAQIVEDLSYAKAVVDGEAHEEPDRPYVVVRTVGALRKLVRKLLRRWQRGKLPLGAIAIDTEATSLRVFDPTTRLISVQIAWGEGKAAFLPLLHANVPDNPFALLDGLSAARAALAELLGSGIPVVGQNIDFDLKVLRVMLGVEVKNVVGDVKLAHTCLHGGTQPNDLEYVARTYLHVRPYKREFRAAFRVGRAEEFPLEALVQYGCRDAEYTLRLHAVLEAKLREANLWEAYQRWYVSKIPTVLRAELHGIRIAQDRLADIDRAYVERAQAATQAVERTKYAARWQRWMRRKGRKPGKDGRFRLNLQSWQQIQVLLYRVMRFPKRDKSGKKNLSTEADRLRELGEWAHAKGRASYVRVVREILRYRKATKIRGTYIRGLVKRLHDTGQEVPRLPSHRWLTRTPWVVHAKFNLGGAATGRMSSDDPNLQNIPVGGPIRAAFVSRFEHGILLSKDYSQMELRILATIAGDRKLLAILANQDPELASYGGDVHLYTACLIYRKSPEYVQANPHLRRRAKSVSFGILYGRGAAAIAAEHDMTVEEAQDLIDRYFELFDRVHRWIRRQHKLVHRQGAVWTKTGRYCPLPAGLLRGRSRSDLTREERAALGHAEREAVNFEIQGPASDIGLEAWHRISDALVERGLQSRVFAPIHDSLEHDVTPDELLAVNALADQHMLRVDRDLFPWVKIPLVVETKMGADWKHQVLASYRGDAWTFTGSRETWEGLRPALRSAYRLRNEAVEALGPVRFEPSETGLSADDIEPPEDYEKVRVKVRLVPRTAAVAA